MERFETKSYQYVGDEVAKLLGFVASNSKVGLVLTPAFAELVGSAEINNPKIIDNEISLLCFTINYKSKVRNELLVCSFKLTLICDPIHQRKEHARDYEGNVNDDSPDSSFSYFCLAA